MMYRVYSNGGTGGPVDYGTPIASVDSLSYQTGPLSAPGDYTFAVRAFDPVTGLDDGNTDARTRIVLDAAGADLGGVLGPPRSVAVSRRPGGAAEVSWTYRRGKGETGPERFSVDVKPAGGSEAPLGLASVDYVRGQVDYRARLSGLAFGTYELTVRALGPLGQGASAPPVVCVLGQAVTPLAMDPITIVGGGG